MDLVLEDVAVDDACVDEMDRIEAAIVNLLPPTARPWTIEVSHRADLGRWNIDVTHEASNGFGLQPASSTADDLIDRLPELLERQAGELRRVAAAPPLTNASWVIDIRTLASIFNWTKPEVRAVVRMLEPDHLDPSEAEWLIEWIGRDAPAPEPARDF